MSSWFLKAVAIVLLLLLPSACLQTVFKAEVSGSEEFIRKEAARNKPVAWKLLLGAGRVDDMASHSPDRMFVSMRKDQTVAGDQHAMLVDTATGRMLWNYDPVERKGEYSRVLMLKEMVVLRFDHQGSTTLVAVSATDGREIWSLPAVTGRVSYKVLPSEKSLLIIVASEGGTDMSTYELASGNKRWGRRFANSGVAFGPVVSGESIWSFYDGIEKISARDGKTAWRRADLTLREGGPAPRLDGNYLYILDKGNSLHRLSAASGKAAWSKNMATGATSFHNIFPLGGRVYLRGSKQQGEQTDYPIIAVAAKNGNIAWTYDNQDTIVSNLIEYDGRLYFATASRLGALDLKAGSRQISIPVTNSGRTYPVQLRRFGDKIVFIGELIVVALDIKKRKIAYKHGFDPIAPSVSLTSLDGHLEKLETQLGTIQETGADNGVLARLYSAEAAHWQERSNYYADLRYSDSALASSPALSSMVSMSDKFARDASRLAFQAALQNLGGIIADAIKTQALQEELESEKFLRRSIMMAYHTMVTKDYVYRPVLNYSSMDKQFITVAVIHLPTGRIRRTSISAPHDDLGLWTLLDPETGIAYHNGVGLDPSDYSYTGKPAGAAEYLNSFLIAQPVKMPN